MKHATDTMTHHQRLAAIAEAAFAGVAIISLLYAAITALGEGKDLAMFQDMGRAWVDGVYQTAEGLFYGPPPFASVLFSPLAVLTPRRLRVVFVVINLIATGLILFLVKKLWGAMWPRKAHLCLAALLLCWAPFRVTVRYGQISLIVTALVLGALLFWKRGAKLTEGLLLGLSFIKYPLTLPFALYFLWRKEWRIVAVAVLTVAALTAVFAFRLGLSPFEVTGDYVRTMLHASITHDAHFAGSTEIGPLLFGLTDSEHVASWLNIMLAGMALVAMALVFWRNPQCEKLHLVVVTFFSLWFVYHRTYDAVICVIPAAVFIDLIVRNKLRRLAIVSMAALGLLSASIPGLLISRLQLSSERLSANPVGFIALHLERLLVFGMFWGFLIVLWKVDQTAFLESNDPSPV